VKIFPGKSREKRGRGDSSGGTPKDEAKSFRWRANFVLALLVCGALGLTWRAVELQLKDHKFLAGQGDARFTRVAEITAPAARSPTATANRSPFRRRSIRCG
jgi:hypothetical protein